MFAASTLKEPLVQTEVMDRGSVTEKEEPQLKNPDEEFLYKIPCSSQTYYIMRPAENMHIYLWVLKDLSWTQDWYWPALIFGTAALAWCGVLFYEAYRQRSWYEAYMTVGITLWLAANFVWMAG